MLCSLGSPEAFGLVPVDGEEAEEEEEEELTARKVIRDCLS